MKKILQDRKTLYLVLAVAAVSIFTLSIAYAAMSAVLEIHGNSEVVASSWDIHLENVKVKSGSVSANAPQISGTSSVGFDVELNTPGEFYEFTVDVVNEGSIDAMIDSVVKTPNLTAQQAKYIKYEITYANGESISINQTLEKGTTTPIKVRVEYRKDLVASDLPSTATELSLKLTLVYVQSDGSGSSVPNNGANIVKVVSGDGTQVGNEVCIKDECFYVISSTDSTVTMLAKYNLYVGGEYNNSVWTAYGDEVTGKQNSTMLGWVSSGQPYKGTTYFSNDANGYDQSAYEGSLAENYVNEYNTYIISQGVIPEEARLIYRSELINLGCSTHEYDGNCNNAPSWVYSSSYWVEDTTKSTKSAWFVGTNMAFDWNYYYSPYEYHSHFGIRPLITISKEYF